MNSGSKSAPWMDLTWVFAVALVLGGVVMTFTGVSNGIAFPAIALGIALVAVVHAGAHRHPRPSH